MENNNKKVTAESHEYEELSKLYLFEELYQFMRSSTGLSIAIAYMTLILSSMTYVYVLFEKFDIAIVKYVTFEDILATPIKNPDIVITFAAMILILYITDLGNRFKARMSIKYANTKKPIWIRFLFLFIYAPKKRKTNIVVVLVSLVICLISYIVIFASLEAIEIKDDERGEKVEIVLADNNEVIKTTLLGTTANYVFTYNHGAEESVIYYVESIKMLKALSNETLKEESEPEKTQPD
jgi:tRNA-binding EMAP/Myf-like protein